MKPVWHAEARELFKSGTSDREIALMYGKRIDTVRLILNEARYVKALGRHRAYKSSRKATEKAPAKPAKPNTMDIARLFASGKIDRAELSRRLRGEARV